MRLSVCVAALSALSMAASAAELGALTVVSRVGETFDARLQVLDVKQEVPVEIGLGSAVYYKRIGKAMAPELKSLKVTKQLDTSGRVRIVGQEVMSTEEFALVVVMRDEGKTKAKVYNIHLAAAKVVPAVKSAPKTEAVEAVKVPAVVTSEKKASHAKPVVTKKSVKKAETKKQAVKTAKAEARRTVLVKPGMTMWSLAKRTQKAYPDASVNQILVAFVRANPSAFEAGRPSKVKVGSQLLVPSAKQVSRVNPVEAYAIVQLKPEVNALKKPSKSRMRKARRLLGKNAHEVAQRPIEGKTAVTPKVEKSEAKAPSADAVAELQKKLEAERAEAVVKPQSASVTPAVSTPLAAPTENTVPQSATAASEPAAKPVQNAPTAQTPAAEKSEPKVAPPKPQETPVPTETKPAAKAKQPQAKDSISLKKILLALAAVLLALLGGVGVVHRRKVRKARQDLASKHIEPPKMTELHPVAFTRDAATETTNEQIAGIEATVQQRLESDRMAARGFELKGERMGAGVPVKPSVAPVTSTETTVTSDAVPSAPAGAPAVLPTVNEVPSASPVQPGTAEPETPAAPQNAPSEQSAMPSAAPMPAASLATKTPAASAVLPQAPLTPTVESLKTTSGETIEQKLSKARGYIAASLSDRAVALLEEIAMKGNDEQRAAALKLLAGLK